MHNLFCHIITNICYCPLFFFFFNYSYSNGCKPLIVVLICTSLMASDVEYLSMCLTAICIYFFEKGLCKSFAHLKIRLFFDCKVLYISWIKSLMKYMICKYFLPFCELSFPFLSIVLWCTKILFLSVSFITYDFGVLSKKSMVMEINLYFLSNMSFTVLDLKFRSVFYFELIFICHVK